MERRQRTARQPPRHHIPAPVSQPRPVRAHRGEQGTAVSSVHLYRASDELQRLSSAAGPCAATPCSSQRRPRGLGSQSHLETVFARRCRGAGAATLGYSKIVPSYYQQRDSSPATENLLKLTSLFPPRRCSSPNPLVPFHLSFKLLTELDLHRAPRRQPWISV